MNIVIFRRLELEIALTSDSSFKWMKNSLKQRIFFHKYNYFSAFEAGNCVSNSNFKWIKMVRKNSAAYGLTTSVVFVVSYCLSSHLP